MQDLGQEQEASGVIRLEVREMFLCLDAQPGSRCLRPVLCWSPVLGREWWHPGSGQRATRRVNGGVGQRSTMFQTCEGTCSFLSLGFWELIPLTSLFEFSPSHTSTSSVSLHLKHQRSQLTHPACVRELRRT